ncbi:MAG: hypothetical protein HQ539_00145 [Parcubacteria group bacterium]|nr:hypothetical protein [Parcubacteria group bacterium]
MRKTLATLFLAVLVVGMFLPLVSFAADTYHACDGEIEDGKCVGGGANVKKVCYEGIVPCGKDVIIGGSGDTLIVDNRCVGTDKRVVQCQLCHSFIMIDGIIDYVLISIIPYVTVLMIVIGGIMFYFGGAKPELLGKSKTLFKGVLIGLVLIYGAYMIVGIFLSVLGAAKVNPIEDTFVDGVFKINCPVKLPKPKSP